MNGKIWTGEDTATLKRLANAGYSDAEIAAHMGRDAKVIGRKRREMRIERGISAALMAALRRVNIRERKEMTQRRSLALSNVAQAEERA